MNSEMNVDILQSQMVPSRKLMGCRYIFQHNNPKHTVKKVGDFFKQKRIKVLNWPPQSPDLNPIEHLWVVMERRHLDEVPKNQQELKNLL